MQKYIKIIDLDDKNILEKEISSIFDLKYEDLPERDGFMVVYSESASDNKLEIACRFNVKPTKESFKESLNQMIHRVNHTKQTSLIKI